MEFPLWMVNSPKKDCQLPFVPRRSEPGSDILNAEYLTPGKMSKLLLMLDQGTYIIDYPENAAFLTVAWLYRVERHREARKLVSELEPFFHSHRFYPREAESASQVFTKFAIFTVKDVYVNLSKIGKPPRGYGTEILFAIRADAAELLADTVTDGWNPNVPNDMFGNQIEFLAARNIIQRFEEWVARHSSSRHAHRSSSTSILVRAIRTLMDGDLEAAREMQSCVRSIIRGLFAKHGRRGSLQFESFLEKVKGSVRPGNLFSSAQETIARIESIVRAKPHGFLTQGEADMLLSPLGTGKPVPSRIARLISAAIEREAADTILWSGHVHSPTSGFTRLYRRILDNSDAKSVISADLERLYSLTMAAEESGVVQAHQMPWLVPIFDDFRSTVRHVDASIQSLRTICETLLYRFPFSPIESNVLKVLNEAAANARIPLRVPVRYKIDHLTSETCVQAAKLMYDSIYARYYRLTEAFAALRDVNEDDPVLVERFAGVLDEVIGALCGIDTKETRQEALSLLACDNMVAIIVGLDLKLDWGNLTRECWKYIEWTLLGNSAAERRRAACAYRQMLIYLSQMDPLEQSHLVNELAVHSVQLDRVRESCNSKPSGQEQPEVACCVPDAIAKSS